MITRQQIVNEARKWVGTPFQHQGRTRGKAVDCVGLVLSVADNLTLSDVQGMPFLRSDYLNYGPQPVGRFVHTECVRRLRTLALVDAQGNLVMLPGSGPAIHAGGRRQILNPGDILTLRAPTVPCHVAIITDLMGGLGIIHAYSPVAKCVEHTLSTKWLKRIEGVFEFPGVE
jgi:hypothetical protein